MQFCDHFEESTDFLSPAVLEISICDQFWPHFGLILRFEPFWGTSGCLRSTYNLKTPIVNEVMWSFWGVNRLSISRCSQVMNFWPILTPFWPNFEIQALFGILGHFRLSERYMYLKTTILNQSCDHFEGSTRLCTTIFYKIMNLTQFWEFGPFFAFWAIFRSPVSLKFISHYGFLHKIY